MIVDSIEVRLTRYGALYDADTVAWANLESWIKACHRLELEIKLEMDAYGNVKGEAYVEEGREL